MRVIVARHAQTHSNKEKIMQGSGTGIGAPLTDAGRKQSETLCRHLLAQFDVQTIITSPARRTLDSIAPMKHHVSTYLKDEKVREIDCGDWEGRSIASLESECSNEWQLWKNKPLGFTFPGGESIQDVFNRTDQFLKDLLSSNHLSDVLIISHSATISTLIANITNSDLSEAWETGLGYHKNTQYSIFNFSGSGALLDYTLKIDDHLTNA